MLKKPLFWIALIIILAIIVFIFMGHHKSKPPIQTTPQNASIQLPLNNDPDMPVVVKNEHASKETIAKQTIMAEQETLNLDNNHGVTLAKTDNDVYDDETDGDDDDSDDMASNDNAPTENTNATATDKNPPKSPANTDPYQPFEKPAAPSGNLRQQPGPVDQPHSLDPFKDNSPKTEQSPFSEPDESPQNNGPSGGNQKISAQPSVSSASEPAPFNH